MFLLYAISLALSCPLLYWQYIVQHLAVQLNVVLSVNKYISRGSTYIQEGDRYVRRTKGRLKGSGVWAAPLRWWPFIILSSASSSLAKKCNWQLHSHRNERIVEFRRSKPAAVNNNNHNCYNCSVELGRRRRREAGLKSCCCGIALKADRGYTYVHRSSRDTKDRAQRPMRFWLLCC